MEKVFEIKENIYHVGVVDKGLEVFDIIMETKYGSTYNSYIIKDEKTVLVDTVKSTFKDEFIDNISQVTDIKDIDYVIIHHTEPDHASSLKYILDINPDIVVYCTKTARIYLKNQLNRDFNFKTISDGEILNIGKRDLKFISAPMLHWADTMFTYDEYDKILFTCDAFGCHYGTLDCNVIDDEEYIDSSKVYYDCIVKPFAPNVLSAINKVVELNLQFDTILTSHGPILSKDPMKQVSRYLEWSKDMVSKTNNDVISIFYLSAYGNTKQMAYKIEEGIKSEGVDVNVYDLEQLTPEEVHDKFLESKVVLLGSPTINRSMVKPMWDLFSVIDPMANKGTVCGVFGSYGWSGEGISICESILKTMGFRMPIETVKKKFFPSAETLDDCFKAGVEYAKILKNR